MNNLSYLSISISFLTNTIDTDPTTGKEPSWS